MQKSNSSKKDNQKVINVWGDGQQTRSFLYIDDCIRGTLEVFDSNYGDVFNIGSEEQVSINQMIDIIENMAEFKLDRNYQLNKPLGVRGRSSDNSFVLKKIGWKPKYSLKDGLLKTYSWIENQLKGNQNIEKFCKSSLEL